MSAIRPAIRRCCAPAAALHDNRIPEAEALLREHLKQAPTDVAAIRMLAELAARLGRNDEAERLLARCLELAPGFHAARQNYALVLHRANKPEQALAEIDALLAVDPDNPGYRNLQGGGPVPHRRLRPGHRDLRRPAQAIPPQSQGLDELRPRAQDRRARRSEPSPPIARALRSIRRSAKCGGAWPT